jgi:hypothetical protein
MSDNGYYPFIAGETLSAAALNAAIAMGQSNQWRNGAGPPADALGVNGDMYLDTTAGDIYQKQSGIYVKTANIKGPAGAPGPATPGPPGPPGPSSGGTVSNIATTGGISGGPITTAGTLAVQWNGPLVNAIGTGLSAAGGTLVVTATGGGAPSGAAGGDLAGTYPNPALAASGVSAGVYGDATHVPVVTVDAKGRVTTVGVATITAPPASFGTITGVATYGQLPAEVALVPIVFGFAGKPSTGAIANAPMAMAVTIPSGLAGTVVFDSTKATASAAFVVNKISGGTTTSIGTVTVTSASNTSATLSGAGGSLAVGDVLQVLAPTQDATLADCSITILASRV